MKIAITRLREKAGSDAALCRRFGHDCTIVSPLEAEAYQDRVIDFVARVNRGEFDCIFFTSALPARLIGPLLERWPRVIAIGPQTARTLKGFGIDCETLPSFYSRDFTPYLGTWLKGKHIGIPRAEVPNPALLESIAAEGGIPYEVAVYRLTPTGEPLNLAGMDAILFTSANSFHRAVWKQDTPIMRIAIGEITASAMEEAGVPPVVVGDGSLEGTLRQLNIFLEGKEA